MIFFWKILFYFLKVWYITHYNEGTSPGLPVSHSTDKSLLYTVFFFLMYTYVTSDNIPKILIAVYFTKCRYQLHSCGEFIRILDLCHLIWTLCGCLHVCLQSYVIFIYLLPKYIFIWPDHAWGMQDLSFLTRYWTLGPQQWNHRILTTESPGKSQNIYLCEVHVEDILLIFLAFQINFIWI